MASRAPILVATDMSARSDRAVARAFRLGRQLRAQVVLIAVLDDAMPEELVPGLHLRTEEMLTKQAKALAGDDVTFRIEVQIGDPSDDILAAIDALHPQLVVLGAHRARPFLDVLRETTMQRIVRRCGAPVLLAIGAEDDDYDKVLAPTDFSPASGASVKLAHKIAPKARIQPLHALHVPYSGMMSQSPEAYVDLQKPFRHEAEAADTAWRADPALAALPATDIVTGPAFATIAARIAKDHYSLIAVGAHGRVGAARAILGSLATDLMREPPCDVLIARP